MIRAIVILAPMFLMVTADWSCSLDSSDVVANGMDGAINIWAATQRCKGTIPAQAPVKCEQDVASAIQSVSLMAGAIADMIGSCDKKAQFGECGLSVNKLVGATAGLAAAGGLMANKCGQIPAPNTDLDADLPPNAERATRLGKCTADAGESINSIFQVSNTVRDARKHCYGKAKGCPTSAFNVLSIIANMGSYIASTVTNCVKYEDEQKKVKDPEYVAGLECTESILSAIAGLSEVAAVGASIKDDCAATSSRLYLESNAGANTEGPFKNPTVLVLAAILPITAVASFIAGSRFAKSRKETRVLIPEGDELE